ncbi:hypothetical protein HPB52_017647 [Rhipicephalus sanguineus]|uniref:Uncharacterized protein n=1 Tax=Rhipicephalus sanguineus TaxID=34632 RepID=A0A9D4PK21_RHISA|nr:hypothetical protein HPB52_017647 [Rhipicephalus sanguineus]
MYPQPPAQQYAIAPEVGYQYGPQFVPPVNAPQIYYRPSDESMMLSSGSIRTTRPQNEEDDDAFPDEIIPLICCTILLLLVIMIVLLILVSNAYGNSEEDSGTGTGTPTYAKIKGGGRFTLICVFEFLTPNVWGPVHQCTDYVYIRMYNYEHHRTGDQKIEFTGKKLVNSIGLRLDWDTSAAYGHFFFAGDLQMRRAYLQFPQADLYMGMWGMTYVRLLESLWTIQEINRSIYEFVRTPLRSNINYTRFEGFAIINSIVRDNRGHHQANETYVYDIFKNPQYPILLPGWKFIHTMSIWPFWPVHLPLEKIVHVANFPDIFGVSTTNTTEEHNAIWYDASYVAPVNWVSPPNPIYRANDGTRGMLDIIAEFPYWKQLLNQSKVCFSVTTSINYATITSLPIDFHNELNVGWFNAVRFRRFNFTGINDGTKKLNVEDMDMHYEFENRSRSHMWVHRYAHGIVSVFIYDDAATLAPKIEQLLDAWPHDRCVVFDDIGEDSLEGNFTYFGPHDEVQQVRDVQRRLRRHDQEVRRHRVPGHVSPEGAQCTRRS